MKLLCREISLFRCFITGALSTIGSSVRSRADGGSAGNDVGVVALAIVTLKSNDKVVFGIGAMDDAVALVLITVSCRGVVKFENSIGAGAGATVALVVFEGDAIGVIVVAFVELDDGGVVAACGGLLIELVLVVLVGGTTTVVVSVEFCIVVGAGVETSVSVKFPAAGVSAGTSVSGEVVGKSVVPIGDHVPEAPHDGKIAPNSPIPAVKLLPNSKKSTTG